MSSEPDSVEVYEEEEEEVEETVANPRRPRSLKRSVVQVCGAALGGAVVGGSLGFGIGLAARDGAKSAALEAAFALRTVAVVSAVYTGVLEAFTHLQDKFELPSVAWPIYEALQKGILDRIWPRASAPCPCSGVEKALAGCTAGVAAAIPGSPAGAVRGCASFGLAALLLDLFLPDDADAASLMAPPARHRPSRLRGMRQLCSTHGAVGGDHVEAGLRQGMQSVAKWRGLVHKQILSLAVPLPFAPKQGDL